MKILVCDPCKKENDKIVETNKSLKVKGKSWLNIEVCDEHQEEFHKLSFSEYEKRVLTMHDMAQLVPQI